MNNNDKGLQSLLTGNKCLNEIVNLYFVNISKLNEPKIGIFKFKDISHHFAYSIREYSIVNSCVIQPSERPSTRKLLILNNININDIRFFVKKINNFLLSHTDCNYSDEEKYRTIEKQIREFLNSSINTNDFDGNSSEYKMNYILNKNDDFGNIKRRYLNRIVSLMERAEINQIKYNKYLLLEEFFDTRLKLEQLEQQSFFEKKKYIIKLIKHNKPIEQQIITLKKYCKGIQIENSSINDYEHEPCMEVRLFLWYLIYGLKKQDIYQVHNIVGYKYNELLSLYKHVFRKENKTASQNNFLHHTAIIEASTISDKLLEQVLIYTK
jgi:hypothetical protein